MAAIEKVFLSVVLSALMIVGAAYKAQANPDLTPEELAKAKGLYFNRCAGCHGTLRKGATGPNITDVNLKQKNYDTNIIKAFVTNGTGGGMPSFGSDFSAEDIELIANFLQQAPPAPPEFSLAEMKESWRLIVPEAQRPKKPEHNRNWQNFFGIVLRDAGKVAILDGDTKELVSVVDTGFAVHILRSSASGRYFYSIGRDGKSTMIDLWMAKPDKVAEAKTCFDARSIDSSKYKGKKGNFEDKLAIVGCYWPPHFVVLDGQTLEPKKVVSTRSYSYDTNEYIPEARVAAIISAHKEPEWIINVKEAGYIWAIDYSDIKNLKITQVETERFLHDGGWDATKRYIQMAANMRNKMVIVDSVTKKQIAQIETGNKPHPGRGANWEDPEFGPVTATPHLGEGLVAAWGSDPKGHPKNAWKVVRKVETLGGGGLFVKTHPKANHVWVDHTLNPDDKIKRSLCAFEKHHPEEKPQCWQVADHGRVVHMEYNKAGNEVWVAVWDKVGELVIYDDKTLKEKSRIKGDWLVTPTGHFNVYNTMTDTY
ncbi:MAG: c-type cytochrome [Deltaproteobacteria bacterium]|nr:c-type cytochrome [Deltaproteobacteria bacterium]